VCVGGGGIVVNLNNCPVLCPGTSIIKSVSGCPSSGGGSSGGGSKHSSSTSSSSSSSSYSTKNDEMRILGYLEGCQGSNAVFNSTIENNEVFKKAYGSGSDCSDDLMANVQQIMAQPKTPTKAIIINPTQLPIKPKNNTNPLPAVTSNTVNWTALGQQVLANTTALQNLYNDLPNGINNMTPDDQRNEKALCVYENHTNVAVSSLIGCS
jgi:hypothetical protein